MSPHEALCYIARLDYEFSCAMIAAVLFDLDGTLADTALDLGWALNALLREEGRSPQSFAAIRPVASHGARGLVRLGFGMDTDHPEFERLRLRFLDLYEQHFAVDTVLFDGVNLMLDALVAEGMAWGIVTNKPRRFTDRLVPQLGFCQSPGVVVSGDTTHAAKPDAAPMLHACKQLAVSPADCVYVGDAERDIVAGRVVGMQTMLARWGYIADHEQPELWGADHEIGHPLELLPVCKRLMV